MKKTKLLAICGALLGGIIATIPWVLVYVYGNMMFSLLAVFVATGALKGYQLCKGKVTKKLPLIITTVSLISISIATLLIIPALLLMKESASISVENFQYLYSNGEFIAAMIKDYFITIIFTFLGISGVINSIKKQTAKLSDNEINKIDLTNGDNQKDRENVKKFFQSKNAITPETAIELSETDGINSKTVELLIKEEIIGRIENKYYYQEELEIKKNKKRNYKYMYIIIIVVVVINTITFNLSTSNSSNNVENLNNSIENIESKEVLYNISDEYKEYQDGDNNWYYVPKTDLSGYSGLIKVYYYDIDYTYSNEWAKSMEENLRSFEEGAKVDSALEYKSPLYYQVVEFNASYKEFDEVIYCIFNNKKLAIVEVIDYRKNPSIRNDGKKS